MIHSNFEKIEGIKINKEINEREIKIIASKNSNIKRDSFTSGMSIIKPGKIHEEHQHDDSEELMFVIEGKGIAKISGKELEIYKGSIISLDKGETHGFINTGGIDLKILWVYCPPGPEKFFLDQPSS